jgi:hypothetical protein
MTVRPSVVVRSTSTIWIAAIFSSTDLGVSPGARDRSRCFSVTCTLARDTAAWREWVEGTTFDPVDGIPAPDAHRVCSRVAAWALRHPEDPLRRLLGATASDLGDAISAVGTVRLSRHLLTRMIEEALGPGSDDPSVTAEAAPWSSVTTPGAVWGPVETVVWWAPSAPSLPRPPPWTVAEQAALASAGCPLDQPMRAFAAASHGWRQPILQARKRVILVLPRRLGGGEALPHPLLHELRTLLDASPAVTLRAETLLAGTGTFAERVVPRSAVSSIDMTLPRRLWRVSPGLVQAPTTASASSIGQMLGCPFGTCQRL